MPSTSPLNNANLDESILPTDSYNTVPRIDNVKPDPVAHEAGHTALLNLIKSNNLSDIFSVHLIHKHFNCPNGQVMVYESVKGGGQIPDFMIMTPRDPASVHNLRGVYFTATPDNKMAAYEYTTLPGADLSAYEDFVAHFAAAANDLGVADVFCLSALGTHGDDSETEFEMPEYKSTILVNSRALPFLDQYDYIGTDWSPAGAELKASEAAAPPGFHGLLKRKCCKTDQHYCV